MWKKTNIFGYFTILGILLVLFIVMLQHRIKSQCLLDDMIECQFSVILHWLLFKMISTLLYAQFCASQWEVVACLIVSPFFPNQRTPFCTVPQSMFKHAHSNVTVDSRAYVDSAFLLNMTCTITPWSLAQPMWNAQHVAGNKIMSYCLTWTY